MGMTEGIERTCRWALNSAQEGKDGMNMNRCEALPSHSEVASGKVSRASGAILTKYKCIPNFNPGGRTLQVQRMEMN